jgi:uncharacterized protein YegJ (DUF2314 family)/rubredoxin
MSSANVLPPVAHAMRAELLLDAHLPLDPERITAAIAKRGLKERNDRQWEQAGDAFFRTMTGGEARIVQRSMPRDLAGIAGDIDDKADGWDASGMRRHTHVIELSVGSPELSASLVSRILISVVAALVDLAGQSGVEVLGVIMGSGRLLPGKIVQLSALMHPAVSALAGVRAGKPGDGYVMRTIGLAELGLLELEVTESNRELARIDELLQHWSYRLITEGPSVLRDGITTGEPGKRVEVRTAPAAGGTGMVYRLSYAADQGTPLASAPSAPTGSDMLESVQCPECGKTVEAPVMRFAFIPLLMKCPSCGAGPVALLEQMLDGVGGGKVTLTIEGRDVVAIASLLASHDPAFDTVIEASDYLREHYRDGRVEVRMHRVFATKLYSEAEKSHPGLRVHCDEALGVLKPDGSIFHSPTSDTVMQDAIAAARASTPSFIARMESPQAGDHNFGIKFPFRDGDEVEHMWVSDVRREGDEFVGIVEAEARLVGNVTKGAEVRVPVSEISDWGFSNGNAIHGNYTTRVMLDTLPPPMRRALAARLVPLG